MTLIAYVDKTFYADNKVMTNFEDSSDVVRRRDKIFVSKNKHFAYGKAGAFLCPKHKELFETGMTKFLQARINNAGVSVEDSYPGEEFSPIFDMHHDGPVIVMSHDGLYEVGKDTVSDLDISINHPMAYGSGASLFQFGLLLIEGKRSHLKISDLFKKIAEISVLSGELTTVVEMSSLKPMKKESVK